MIIIISHAVKASGYGQSLIPYKAVREVNTVRAASWDGGEVEQANATSMDEWRTCHIEQNTEQ